MAIVDMADISSVTSTLENEEHVKLLSSVRIIKLRASVHITQSSIFLNFWVVGCKVPVSFHSLVQ